MLTFKPLWKTLIDKSMNKTDLKNAISCSFATIASMSKDEPVSMTVLNKICKALDCKIEDVIEYVD